VDIAISLIESVNRAILFNEFTYPELKGLITPKFIINSGGGDVIQGLRLFDAIKNNIYPFTTIASGMAASMGIILLVAGAKVKAAPHTVLLIHPLSAGMEGDFYKLEGYMKLYTDLQTKLTDILIENTSAKKEDVIDFMTGESFIMAKEALDLGIIDEIVPTI
jgi:ATP-dependent Clp protease protease subunit